MKWDVRFGDMVQYDKKNVSIVEFIQRIDRFLYWLVCLFVSGVKSD